MSDKIRIYLFVDFDTPKLIELPGVYSGLFTIVIFVLSLKRFTISNELSVELLSIIISGLSKSQGMIELQNL